MTMGTFDKKFRELQSENDYEACRSEIACQ
jgi:hypothetical protein